MIFISIGANLGNCLENITKALAFLEENGIEVIATSSVYLTAPWGFKEQPPFLNLVAQLNTHLPPHPLLKTMLEVEARLGRKREQRWGPRIIDLDLLCYYHLSFEEENLCLPHPYWHERAFVLIPWYELAPLHQVVPTASTIAHYSQTLAKDQLKEVQLFAPPLR
ncbi:MAG: 2-amino-4-hydroxy-6-hydroxymethyldihydropteridine diphosphokinase [Bacteroidia bacterium]|nr:2-amino-4-hydroxy-6-hydroxymethyldihydropteridine diphosphokinase [Bacteroidia bacterium]MDW8158960.1 2-amino-4-hydroxy-6-hydroxymethyldihydropteridine diphosphokinase [Bacteroidia bacterium]